MITVKIRSGIWLNAGEEKVVRRCADVIAGTDVQVKTQDSGYKWDISGNTWWATEWSPIQHDEEGAYREIGIEYRYRGSGKSRNGKAMVALEVWLNWVFH